MESDREKYYNNEIIKKFYESGLFTDIISTDSFCIVNVSNIQYTYFPYTEDSNHNQAGIAVPASFVKNVFNDNKYFYKYFASKEMRKFLAGNLASYNEKAFQLISEASPQYINNPYKTIDKKMEEEILDNIKIEFK